MDINDYILFSDEALLAVNKPAGLLTIADGYDPSLPHLSDMLQKYFGKVWVVHRLDKETSGVILFALTADAHRNLNIQFQLRETRKEYHALALGVPDWQRKRIDLPLKVNGDRRHRTIVNQRTGKQAQTDVTILHSQHGMSYLAAFPHTGYTHQIRAHLAAVGLPLLHDPLYKSRLPETPFQKTAQEFLPSLPIKRIALHAYRITIKHPQTGLVTTIHAPEPDDFLETRKVLENPL